MSSRARVAAAACLVASGLIVAGAGSAIALADPDHGYGSSDDRHDNNSLGDVIRRALGVENGSDQQGSTGTGQQPQSRTGNSRLDEQPGENESPGDTTDTKTEQSPTDTTKPSPTDTTTKTTETTTKTTETTTTTTETTTPTTTETSEPPLGQPPPGGGTSGGGGGAVVQGPPFHRPQVPPLQLPSELQPGAPGGPPVLDAGADAVAAPVAPAAPIELPVIVLPPIGVGAGAGAGGPAGVPSGPAPGAPRGVGQPPAAREPVPASAGSNAAPAPSYRVGYSDYLRTAGLPQVAALAVPGIAGILVLTGAGGLVGYRQAKAGLAVRAGGTARFMR